MQATTYVFPLSRTTDGFSFSWEYGVGFSTQVTQMVLVLFSGECKITSQIGVFVSLFTLFTNSVQWKFSSMFI